jgi:hypothetical protein
MYRTAQRFLVLMACSCASSASADWQPAPGPLKTRWTGDVSPQNAHPEYPRPQLVRKEWLSLNGLWDFTITPQNAGTPQQYSETILVPFPVESSLSGLAKRVSERERLWYRRIVTVPKSWLGRRVILHFGAVDFEAVAYVNGKEVGQHRGGYDSFSFDITAALDPSGVNELVVSAWDPTDSGTQPRGKQVQKPGGIFYTPTSGIWQTVWLEPVTAAHVTGLRITPDIDENCVRVQVETPVLTRGYTISAAVFDRGAKVAEADVRAGDELTVPVKKARLWSPESPHLYQMTVSLKLGSSTVDRVESYFGMRKISLGKDEKGFTRLLLNNKPYFQFGPLDQGFWPDGLYTAPTDEALRYDIEMTKKLGFNMARKHVKVEPARWYYWCDRLGLLVWQDMPSGDKFIGGNDHDITRSSDSASQYEQELAAMIHGLQNHPSIIMWVPYNEGWGQWDTARIAQMVKKLDPSRLVDSASGWTDRGVGDVNDMHNYPGPGSPNPESKRAAVLGEFGGLGLPMQGHTWQSEKNWGYRSFKDSSGLTSAYIELVWKLFPLIEEKGLSAAVYTQTTDVEGEVNGLMTYDRAQVKMDQKRISAANRGQLPPAPKRNDVVPTAQTQPALWQYSFEQPASDWYKPEFNAAGWKQGKSGFGTRGTPGAIIGTEWNTSRIWLRREFSLPEGKLGDLRLFMHHDEDAEVYLNGVSAAKDSGYTSDYQDFQVSSEARATLKPAGNVIAVHCSQTDGGQYIDVGLVQFEQRR